jgi:hypothetical protein
MARLFHFNVVAAAFVAGATADEIDGKVGDLRRLGKAIEKLEEKIKEAEKEVEASADLKEFRDNVPKGRTMPAEQEQALNAAIRDAKDDKAKRNAQHQLDLVKELVKNKPSEDDFKEELKKEARRKKLAQNMDSIDPVVCSAVKGAKCDKWISLMTGDVEDDAKLKDANGKDTKITDNLPEAATYVCTTPLSLETGSANESYGEFKLTRSVPVVHAKAVEELKDSWNFADLSGLKWEEWSYEKAEMVEHKFGVNEHGRHFTLHWDSENSEFFSTDKDNSIACQQWSLFKQWWFYVIVGGAVLAIVAVVVIVIIMKKRADSDDDNDSDSSEAIGGEWNNNIQNNF